MKNYEIHEEFKRHVCKEIEQLEEQVVNNKNISMQELEKLDKFYHMKKSMLTADAMEEAEEYEQPGFSGYRGRAANGRYVSRDGGNSYADGYSRGYSEAMTQQRTHGGTPPAWVQGYQNGNDRNW